MDFAQLGMTVDTRDVDKGTRSVRGFASETQKAGKSVGTATTSMAKNWKMAAAAVAAAVVALRTLGGAITLLRQFENSMSQVGAISRATASELAAMRDVAKDLGSSTEFSASQAADGMRFLAMAGFDAKESIAAIPDVLDLATASGMGLATAADIASNIMSAFSVEAENAAEVTDALAAVSSRANTSVEQLGQAMKFVGPIASSLGLGINKTAAAMGVLSDNGLQGSMAGTGLRRVLSSLVNPTNEAAESLSALGVSLEDVNPQTNELTDIVDRLAEAGLDASDALTIFGDRGGPAILALTNSRGRLRELTKEMENVEGAAGDMASQMRDNLEGDAMSLKSAIEGLIISIGDAGLTTVLRGLIQTITAVVRGFTAMVDAIASLPGYVAQFLGMGAAQRELAEAADAVATAMNEEIAKSDILSGSLTAGRTMSLETASVKLAQARAHMSVVNAMQEEAAKEAKLSQAYRDLQVPIDGTREMIADLQEQADEGLLTEQGITQLRVALKILRSAAAAQQEIVDEARGLTPEYQAAQDHLAMLEATVAALSESTKDATRDTNDLATAWGQVAIQASAAASNMGKSVAGGRGRGVEMSDGAWAGLRQGLSFEDQLGVEDEPTRAGGGGGARSGMSEAQQARNALMEEGKRLTLSLRTEQERYNDALARNNQLLQAGAIDTETFKAANNALQQEMAQAQWETTTQNIENLSAGLLQAAMNGENLGEALIQMLAQMAIQWMAAAIAAKAADILSGGILSASMAMSSGAGGGGVHSLLGFANGTNNAPGGMALVGERGPEIVNLPKGSQVIPNDRIGGHMKQSAPQVNVEPQVQVVVLDDPRKIDEYRTTPQGEKARQRANRRMNNA